jgi:hypothetical protein
LTGDAVTVPHTDFSDPDQELLVLRQTKMSPESIGRIVGRSARWVEARLAELDAQIADREAVRARAVAKAAERRRRAAERPAKGGELVAPPPASPGPAWANEAAFVRRKRGQGASWAAIGAMLGRCALDVRRDYDPAYRGVGA